ncbi:hypothetical protein HII31_03969 [Pseudocercospora fuligena]|uniref:Nucleoside phosphorylase domain-containing protein n=1 Tax=Pseudocercospora fuligena TaxID=685502 RepID=A0A8H6RQ07_9PEZI|nr:hypothetical protein HII31_03969 [Pseudocercospora fuligena]
MSQQPSQQNWSNNHAGGQSRNHYGNHFGNVYHNYSGSPAPAASNNRNEPQVPSTSSGSNARPRSLDEFQIAIICALKKEYDAVDALMEEVWDREEAFKPRRPDSNTYTFGRLGGKPVALVNLPSMGEISAAGVASHIKISLPNIEIAFLVGLCAGAPNDGKGNEISMADVIIGTQVIQEDYGRLRDEGFERKTAVEDVLGRLPPRVRGWLVQRSGRRHLKELRQHTESVLSKAFEDSETADDFAFPGRQAYESFPSSRKLKIFFGRIGSSNPTLRSQVRRDEMIKQDRILGFEMESAGVWDQLPTVVVKAVCDYGDDQKNKEWQEFAALVAAACTTALVRDWVLHV